MHLAGQFRSHATQCLRQAEEAPTAELRAHWLSTAQLWHDIAIHLEAHHTNAHGSMAPSNVENRTQARLGGE